MIVIREPTAAHGIQQPEIRRLTLCRLELLAEEEPFAEGMASFIVMEPGDTAAALNEKAGFDVLTNRYSGIRFDQPGFAPSFELLEEHGTCFEIVYVLSDDGYGLEVFVPKVEGIDPDLLAMCHLRVALLFLEHPLVPVNPIVEALVYRLDVNLREAFEERAGVMQFEAGKERELAEALALLDVIRVHPLGVSGLVVLRGTLASAPVTVLTTDRHATEARLGTLGATGVVVGSLPMALASLGGAACLTTLKTAPEN